MNSTEADLVVTFCRGRLEDSISLRHLLRQWTLSFPCIFLMVTGLWKDQCLSGTATDTNTERDFYMSLVKLTRNGLLLLTFLGKTFPNPINIVSNIFQFFGTGSLKSPQCCHRVYPIQATSCLNEKELQATVS